MRSALLLAALALGSCRNEPPPEPPESPWAAQLGRELSLEGIARNDKLGPWLETGDGGIAIDRAHWTPDFEGKRLRVSGTVIRKNDLPVFIPKPGEPVPGGIPVPEGTDLKKASLRYLLQPSRIALVP